jgi:alkaline phosphatase D
VDTTQNADTNQDDYDFVVAFGSCNKQDHDQPLWPVIAKQNPDIFIWGGDNIYADTDDMSRMKADYQKQLKNTNYQTFLNQINQKVYGVWDDHDYGKNDAGAEWPYKAESQQLFLDFMGVDSLSVRRKRAGIYHAENLEISDKTIKIIGLDTRYFRSPLQEDNSSDKRYKPWQNGEGTLLGETQWEWFENQLRDSNADYHIIMSSIQVWSDEHGWETWGNFPHEAKRLKTLLNTYQPKNILILSGDRHISEFSSQDLENYSYPIIDFTSSGLTHAYTKFTSEKNTDRVGNVVAQESFGVLKYDFEEEKVILEMHNEDGKLQDLMLNFKG